ncbi:fimbrial protein [Serratia sp. DD3]|uniref:fimbrial protein n=1 Tax=Serratia sp. DD3 TaxID=1410619 RepID=UPI0003C4F177|nr:fimbrial protein [Serratia sp. DD3]KEY58582.1 fimbrial protein [Serratia sp. DD3]
MKKIILMCLLLQIIVIKSVSASCSMASRSPPLNMNIPLQASNITVGPDTANGTVIYRQTYKPSFNDKMVECTTTAGFILERAVTVTPYPLSSWSGSPYPGHVYNTNIPGIGIAIWNAGTAFPFTVNLAGSNSTILTYGPSWFTFDISLIKIGNVSPGSLTGASLPCISHKLGQAGSVVPAVSACFTGAINIVSRTCTTPDISVSLGNYDVKKFTGLNSTTSWIDSSIKLTNCPVFYGTYPDTGSNTYVSWSESGSSSLGTPVNNKISLTLTPNTSVINATNGIMSIDTSAQNAASGVGIQVAAGTASSPTLFNFNSVTQQAMLSTQGSNVSIPLVARYIQTSPQVTPGTANGKITFTINYY